MQRGHGRLLPLTFVLATPLHAQDPPAKPEPAAPKSASASRVAPTFAALHVTAEELPAGWKLEKELACVSTQPRALLEDDVYSQILPKPKQRDFQTFASPTGKGSILYFEWGDRIPHTAEKVFSGLLFGEDAPTTREHPEEIVHVGGVMLIVSFPLESPERRFVIDRLRTKFGLRLVRDLGAAKPLIQTLYRHWQKETKEEAIAGLAYATEHAAELAGLSTAASFEGMLATTAEQWARAELAFRRALELDATTDPLSTDYSAWQSQDGLGSALYHQKKYAEAARALSQAATTAADQRLGEEQAQSLYNSACCLALLGKADDALAALKRSIELDPKLNGVAAKDDDFASLKARPDFQALLK